MSVARCRWTPEAASERRRSPLSMTPRTIMGRTAKPSSAAPARRMSSPARSRLLAARSIVPPRAAAASGRPKAAGASVRAAAGAGTRRTGGVVDVLVMIVLMNVSRRARPVAMSRRPYPSRKWFPRYPKRDAGSSNPHALPLDESRRRSRPRRHAAAGGTRIALPARGRTQSTNDRRCPERSGRALRRFLMMIVRARATSRSWARSAISARTSLGALLQIVV